MQPSRLPTERRSHAVAETGGIQRHSGLADDVYEVLVAQLMALKIPPGARITVDNLVRELKVSQTPIREALGRLEGEGLVVKTHLVGYSAAPQLTRRHFDDLYDFRLLIEPDAARRAAEAMSPEHLSALRDLAGAMKEAPERDARVHYSAFARQDALFHDRVLELAGNEIARQALAHQHAHLHIFRLMYHARVTEEALDEHEALMAAFSSGDGKGAEAAMRDHIARSRSRLVPAFEA